MFRSHDADRDRIRLLGQKKNLLAGVHQPADRQHAIVFTDVGIEENGIASRIDHFSPPRAPVTSGNAIEHPRRRGHDCIRARQSALDRVAIPGQRALRPRSVIVDRIRPRDQIAMRHHHARYIDRQVPVAKLVRDAKRRAAVRAPARPGRPTIRADPLPLPASTPGGTRWAGSRGHAGDPSTRSAREVESRQS